MLGISCAGQLPVQTSSGAAAVVEPALAGRMAAVSRIVRASTILCLALALAGCGDSEPKSVSEEVFDGVVAMGRTQNVRCEPAGVVLRDEPVVGCSFEEERNDLGVMRAVDRCFVVREGVLIDVTREVPVGTSCAVTDP